MSPIDFALAIGSSTRSGLKSANSLVASIAGNVRNVANNMHDANRAIALQNRGLRRNSETAKAMSVFMGKLGYWGGFSTTVYAAVESLKALFKTGESLDQMLNKNMIAFNGYQNSMNAYAKFQDGVISGQLLGNAKDYMDSAKILMADGIKMTDDMTKTLSNWAAASGASVGRVAGAIDEAIHGNTRAFAEFGITERTMKQFKRYTAGTVEMKNAVLNFVKAQTQFNGMTENVPKTWAMIADRLKAMKDKFIEAVIGRANDPNSLNSMLKRNVMGMLDFLNKNAFTFKVYAMYISATLKWIFKQVANFGEFLMEKFNQQVGITQGTLTSYKERVAGFILYLEVIKLRIVNFYKENAWWIDFIVKWYFILKIAAWALAIPWGVIKRVGVLAGAIWGLKTPFTAVNAAGETFNKTLGMLTASEILLWFTNIANAINYTTFSILMGLVPATATWTAIMDALLISMAANPLAWAIGTIAAIVAVVYILWNYWDNILGVIKGVPDSVLLILSYFMPWVGGLLLVVKNWDSIKTIVINVASILGNLGKMMWNGLWNGLKWAYKGFKDLFNTIWNTAKAIFPSLNIAEYIWNGMVKYGKKIYDWISGLLPDWGGKGFVETLANGTTDVAKSIGNGVNRDYGAGSAFGYATTNGKGFNDNIEENKAAKAAENKSTNPSYSTVPSTFTAPKETYQGAPTTSNSYNVSINVNPTGAMDSNQLATKIKYELDKYFRENNRKGR